MRLMFFLLFNSSVCTFKDIRTETDVGKYADLKITLESLPDFQISVLS